MSELVGRFLSFEEHLGRGLVKFVYYILLFLLVVTTLYDLVTAFFDIFDGKPWRNMGKFLVVIPLTFFIQLLLLRVGAELVLAILSIDDNLKPESVDGDVMSSGLNPVAQPRTAMRTAPVTPPTSDDAEAPNEAEKPVAKKTTRKKATKKTTKKKVASEGEPTVSDEPSKPDPDGSAA